MAGFPTRSLRSTIGPTLENKAGLAGPRNTHVNADTFMFTFGLLAGIGLMVPKATMLVRLASTPAISVTTHSESWNVEAEGTVGTIAGGDDIEVATVSTGIFLVTFDSPVLDHDGESVSVGFTHVRPSLMQYSGGTVLTDHTVYCEMQSAASFHIRTHDTAVLADLNVDCLLEIY